MGRAPKNIVICSDGTGQAGGLRPDQNLSNVYKLYRAARSGPDSEINPARQVAYYDAGLGSGEVESAWSRLRKAWSSATGTGFTRNVADCYEAILRHYEPGDRIFLFGFSRGAYTVRSVGGVLNLCGVPTLMPDGSAIPRYGAACRTIAEEAVYQVYEHGAGRPRDQFKPEREEKARRFRVKYSSTSDHPLRGNVPAYFIGVFDTVAALGLSGMKRAIYLTAMLALGVGAPFVAGLLISGFTGWQASHVFVALLVCILAMATAYSLKHRVKIIRDFPNKGDFKWHWSSWKFSHYDQFLDPRVRYARHALAIDEDRATFDRVPWAGAKDQPERTKTEPEWLIQMWFAGNHSDIGGSYPEEESRLSDIALEWMVEQATGANPPLIIDRNNLHLYPDPMAVQHCEIERILDLYPRWWPNCLRWSYKRQRRTFSREFVQHPSVQTRIDAGEVQRMGWRMRYDPYADRPG